MKRKDYDTVTDAMVDLKNLGYTIDFSGMSIQKFMKQNIDGITLQKSIVTECSNCSHKKTDK